MLSLIRVQEEIVTWAPLSSLSKYFPKGKATIEIAGVRSCSRTPIVSSA